MHVKRPIVRPVPSLRRDALAAVSVRWPWPVPALAASAAAAARRPNRSAGAQNAGGSASRQVAGGQSGCAATTAQRTRARARAARICGTWRSRCWARRRRRCAGEMRRALPRAAAAAQGGAVQSGAPAGAGAAGTQRRAAARRVRAWRSAATVPMFADAASCTLTTTDIEGPFYIDDTRDPERREPDAQRHSRGHAGL